MIADDHTLVADLYRNLLEKDYEVVGTVNDGRAIVRVAAKMEPDIVLVDIGMALLNGLDAGLQVKEILPQVKLIFVTANTDIEVAAEAFRRGASGYLLKTCTALEVVTAVRQVLIGFYSGKRTFDLRTELSEQLAELYRNDARPDAAVVRPSCAGEQVITVRTDSS